MLALVLAAGCGGTPASEPPSSAPLPTIDLPAPPPAAPVSPTVRFATFNAALHRDRYGALDEALRHGDAQAARIAAVVQHIRPDVLLINEIDTDPAQGAPTTLAEHYFERPQFGQDPISFPHRFVPPSNTGTPTGLDLDRDGVADAPGDAQGYGAYPGQYGLAVYSRHPILETTCLGGMVWARLPWARLPDDASTPEPGDWYSAAARELLPLSSKNHCDVVLKTPAGPVHFLVSHPTPPAFDGPEDRNGLRNRDEIYLWVRYIEALPPGTKFVLAGDLNSDPADGDASLGVAALLGHPSLTDPKPTSAGAVIASDTQGRKNDRQRGDASLDTADFDDGAVGNLRVDYVLPSTTLQVVKAGVFWPGPQLPESAWVSASDHRLVWLDVAAP